MVSGPGVWLRLLLRMIVGRGPQKRQCMEVRVSEKALTGPEPRSYESWRCSPSHRILGKSSFGADVTPEVD